MTAAINDLSFAIKQWYLWMYLAWTEVRVRYKRSVLGPWWITLSMAITMSAMGLVYGRLFHQDLHEYLPFIISCNILLMFI
jgi:lipopolysaccharide transport system permease protein